MSSGRKLLNVGKNKIFQNKKIETNNNSHGEKAIQKDQMTQTGVKTSSSIFMPHENSVQDKSFNKQNERVKPAMQNETRKNWPDKNPTTSNYGSQPNFTASELSEESDDEQSDCRSTDPEERMRKKVEYYAENWTDPEEYEESQAYLEIYPSDSAQESELDIFGDTESISSSNSKESSSRKRLNKCKEVNKKNLKTTKRQKVSKVAQSNSPQISLSESVANVPSRVKNTKKASFKTIGHLNNNSPMRPSTSSGLPASSITLTNQVSSMSCEMKRIQKEIEALKNARTSELRNFTSFERANVVGIHCCNMAQPARTFVTEEENSQLRDDIKELREKISKTEDELNQAKSSQDKKKYKAQLIKEIKGFEKGCEDVEKLLEIDRKRHEEKRNEIQATVPAREGFSLQYYKNCIYQYKSELEKFKPKILKPKPDPYKTPEHLQKHCDYRMVVENYKKSLEPLKKDIPDFKTIMDYTEQCLWRQNKRKYISEYVFRALKDKHNSILQLGIHGGSDVELNNKFEAELKELEESTAKSAEKTYMAQFSWKPKYSQPSEPQPGCSKDFNESEPGCSTVQTLPEPHLEFPECYVPRRFDTYIPSDKP